MTFNVLLLKSAIKWYRRSVALDKRKIGTACSSFTVFVWNIWIWIQPNTIALLYSSIRLKTIMNLMLMNILFSRKMEFPMTIISGLSKLGSIIWYFVKLNLHGVTLTQNLVWKYMVCFSKSPGTERRSAKFLTHTGEMYLTSDNCTNVW